MVGPRSTHLIGNQRTLYSLPFDWCCCLHFALSFSGYQSVSQFYVQYLTRVSHSKTVFVSVVGFEPTSPDTLGAASEFFSLADSNKGYMHFTQVCPVVCYSPIPFSLHTESCTRRFPYVFGKSIFLYFYDFSCR